jgi:HSP20 family molecular chaperone IbpA
MSARIYALGLVLLLSPYLISQQPSDSQPQGSTGRSSEAPNTPTFPPDSVAPQNPRTSDERPQSGSNPDKENPPRGLTAQEAKIQIVKKLQTEPGLSSRDIKVTVTPNAIVLSGYVPTENQRLLAGRIAESYAGNRKLDNRLIVATGEPGSSKSEHAQPPEPEKVRQDRPPQQ